MIYIGIDLRARHFTMPLTAAKSEKPTAELDTIETNCAGSSGVVSVTD